MISVTIHKPDAVLATQWDDLVSRAQPNVFMNPAALKAAADTMFAVIHVLMAWDMGCEEPKLIGLWALRERRAFPFWPKILDGLPYEYAFLSNPVVDHAYVTQVIPAFLAAIEAASDLPKVVALRSMDGEASTYDALVGGLQDRGGRLAMLKSEGRPYALRESFTQQSGERRKKLRQSWRRLNEIGPTEVLHYNEPAAVSAGLEAFLDLEYRSWKGSAGTALLCKETDAAFARRLVTSLAASGEAAIHVLQVNGRPIAAQVVFFSGSVAYTWKTGFDEGFARFSPGVTLIDRSVDDLLAVVKVEAIDSCSIEASFMARICSGRRTMHDVLIDVGPAKSITFSLEAARLQGRERLKRLRDRVRAVFADRAATKPVPQPDSRADAKEPATDTTKPFNPKPKRNPRADAPIRMTEPSPSIASGDSFIHDGIAERASDPIAMADSAATRDR